MVTLHRFEALKDTLSFDVLIRGIVMDTDTGGAKQFAMNMCLGWDISQTVGRLRELADVLEKMGATGLPLKDK